MAEGTQQTPHQSGLARAEFSREVQHAARPYLRGERCPERKGRGFVFEPEVKMRRHGLRETRRGHQTLGG